MQASQSERQFEPVAVGSGAKLKGTNRWGYYVYHPAPSDSRDGSSEWGYWMAAVDAGIEDEDVTSGSLSAFTRFGLGARGIDFMEKVTSSSTVTAYPIYDAHGNMVATLQRSGTNSYTFGDQRSYDAWGKVRSGSGTGDPKGTYCASLGHKQDDESGLIYMRARYYEPASGRFVSEDRATSGSNWYIYSKCNPVGGRDRSGLVSEEDKTTKFDFSSLTVMISLGWLVYSAVASASVENRVMAWSGLVFLAAWFNIEMFGDQGSNSLLARIEIGGAFIISALATITPGIAGVAVGLAENSPAVKAVEVCKTYSAILTLFMSLENLETQ